jgi:hypothetical protein
MTTVPSVSVLMAVYNGEPYLEAAISSILQQTYDDFEFVIVDDCSTDATAAVITSFEDDRVRYTKNGTNLGQTASLNRGLGICRGRYIARMDADDLARADRFEKQVAFLEARPKVAVVGSNLEFIDSTGSIVGSWDYPSGEHALRWFALFSCPLSNGAAVFRKDVVWDQLGGYDETIVVAQDWDLWNRVLSKSEIANLRDRLLQVRQHDGQVSIQAGEQAKRDAQRICVEGPRHILRVESQEDLGIEGLHLLPYNRARQERRAAPQLFLETVINLHGRFLAKYPSSSNDPEIACEVGKQLIATVESARLRHPFVAVRACRQAWRILPTGMFVHRLALVLAITLIGRERCDLWLHRIRRFTRRACNEFRGGACD